MTYPKNIESELGNQKLLTTRELASILRISESNLRKLVHRQAIPCIRLGPRTFRFDPEAIDRWRAQFFDIGGYEDNGTTENREYMDLSMQDKRENMVENDRRNGQKESRRKNTSARSLGSIASKSAYEIGQIISGHSG